MSKLHKIFWENQPSQSTPSVKILDYVEEDEDISLEDLIAIINTATAPSASVIILQEADIPAELKPVEPELQFHVDDKFDAVAAIFPAVVIYTSTRSVTKEDVARAYIKYIASIEGWRQV